jgi:hypothetical protein
MTGRVLVTRRGEDGDIRFYDDAHPVHRERVITSLQLAQLRQSVARSRNGLVWWDGIYLDESDVTMLIKADAELGASE